MCAPEGIKGGIYIVRPEFRAWEAGMKASSPLDDGRALCLKTNFVNVMQLGSHATLAHLWPTKRAGRDESEDRQDKKRQVLTETGH